MHKPGFKFRGNFGPQASKSSNASVFALGLWPVLRASLRALAGAISIGWAAPAPRTDASTGCRQTPEQGADWQPPAAALAGQLCCQWILLYLCIYCTRLRSSCCLRAFKTSKKFSQLSRRKVKKPCIRPLFTFMAAWIIQCWRWIWFLLRHSHVLAASFKFKFIKIFFFN